MTIEEQKFIQKILAELRKKPRKIAPKRQKTAILKENLKLPPER